MRTVADESGTRYLLLGQAPDEWVVRDPRTGEQCGRPAGELSVVEDVSPLTTAGRAAPDRVREAVSLPGDRAVGLLAEIHAREPVGVRGLLGAYDLCESDLHGLLAEFTAGGLIRETMVAGERGYETTAHVATLFADAE